MRIGLLCSVGDAAGMNACLAAAVQQARQVGCEIAGIQGGYPGLAGRKTIDVAGLPWESLSRRGGCVLGSARRPANLSEEDLLGQAVEGCRDLFLDGLVVLGGNGSLRGLSRLAATLPCAGVPATIDNDLAGSVLSIGFDTALQYGIQALDPVRDTAEAMGGRVFTIQTLGGDTGHLAVAVAFAGFADLVLAPEIEVTADRIVERARGCLTRQGHLVAVVAEGSPWAEKLGNLLEDALGVRVRASVLGHAQRGGAPTASDRTLARMLGAAAVDCVRSGNSAAITWDGEAVHHRDLALAAAPKPLSRAHYGAVWEDGQVLEPGVTVNRRNA